MSKSRVFTSAALAGMLIIAGLSAGPAFADDPPPLVWTTVSGFPITAGEVTVEFESTQSTTPFGNSETIDPVLIYRPEITNLSSETKFFGFGTDFVTQGTIDPLWTRAAWGAFDDVMEEGTFLDMFWAELPPGASLSTGAEGGSAESWYEGMPSWSGHTITVFELSEAPIDAVTPTATPLASLTTAGRFVGADLSDGDVDNLSSVLGHRATVSGAGGTAELFPGLTATVAASGLTPGDQLELWIAEDFNYVFFQIFGGGLPVGSVKVGDDVVAADGTLSATITLPSDLSLGEYQLVAGVRAERYWPAGSYDDFHVTIPTTTTSVVSAGAGTVPMTLGPTQLTLTLPSGTTAGTTTATVSGTGPAVDGFQLLSDPPLYYHIDTTATLGGPARVCISFDPGILSPYPPQLFHFDVALDRWVDITTTRSVGQVCGMTSSFSPFAVGYVETPRFDFSGFFEPVSMTSANSAKAGQAIPVKFSLHGDKGLAVVSSAKFVSGAQTFDADTADGGGLTYDRRADRYTYVWKTAKTLAQKSGRFELTLSDGTVHSFEVAFKK